MRVRGSDTSRLRRINMVTAMRALRGHGAIGLTELASRAGLSRPTVEGLAEDLLASGWLAESPPETGQMGRPRRLFRFRAEAGYVLGVDVGSFSVRALVCDLEGHVMGRSVTRLTSEASRVDRLDGVRSAARGALREAGLEAGRLMAACVGTTGVVTREGVVKLSVALPEWTGVDLVAELNDDIGPVVLVENDCNLAALAERWTGVATGARDLVFVLSGVRTGAGLLIGGELYAGGRGMAGEIGALPLVGWHRAPSHLAGFPGLPAGTAAEEVAGLVFAAARQGDPAARWAVEQYAHDLAEGIAALVLTMDPDLVVIGGGVSRSGDVLLEPLRRHLDPLCLEPPELAVSTLGDQAVVLGAVRHALDHVDARLYDVDATLPEAQPS